VQLVVAADRRLVAELPHAGDGVEPVNRCT
jgi:hypothetical protein